MSNRITIKEFRMFLKHQGLVLIRTTSSHEQWDYPDESLNRPVVVDTNSSEIVDYHLSKNLKTLNITKKDFLKILKEIK
jgi:predicted RNA binding protein YcfA (HicA-like mRNA interferase family)